MTGEQLEKYLVTILDHVKALSMVVEELGKQNLVKQVNNNGNTNGDDDTYLKDILNSPISEKANIPEGTVLESPKPVRENWKVKGSVDKIIKGRGFNDYVRFEDASF